MEVVGGAVCSYNPLVAFAAMLITGIVLSIFGIGSLCWLMFTLAVYALPFFAGMSAGLAAYHSGAGVIGALVVGVAAGAVTLIAGQFIFATVTSPLLRGLIALLFAAPATVAGYHATLALARLGVPAEGGARGVCRHRRDRRWRHRDRPHRGHGNPVRRPRDLRFAAGSAVGGGAAIPVNPRAAVFVAPPWADR